MALKLLSFDGASNQYKQTPLSWDTASSKLSIKDVDSEYITGTLNANATAEVFTSFTFSKTAYFGTLINYSIREENTNKTRVGMLLVCTDGDSSCNIIDQYGETSGVDVKWGVVISGADVHVTYTTNNVNNKSINAITKKFITVETGPVEGIILDYSSLTDPGVIAYPSFYNFGQTFQEADYGSGLWKITLALDGNFTAKVNIFELPSNTFLGETEILNVNNASMALTEFKFTNPLPLVNNTQYELKLEIISNSGQVLIKDNIYYHGNLTFFNGPATAYDLCFKLVFAA